MEADRKAWCAQVIAIGANAEEPKNDSAISGEEEVEQHRLSLVPFFVFFQFSRALFSRGVSSHDLSNCTEDGQGASHSPLPRLLNSPPQRAQLLTRWAKRGPGARARTRE